MARQKAAFLEKAHPTRLAVQRGAVAMDSEKEVKRRGDRVGKRGEKMHWQGVRFSMPFARQSDKKLQSPGFLYCPGS